MVLEKLDDRDQQLMSLIREVQESKLEIAALIEDPNNTSQKNGGSFGIVPESNS